MKRRIDVIDHWHCAHACDHVHAEQLTQLDAGLAAASMQPKAWRYSIISGDLALSLTISSKGGEMAEHRSFPLPREDDEMRACDLLRGKKCYFSTFGGKSASLASPAPIDMALGFWSAHAEQGRREQGEDFWKALEALAHIRFVEVREERYKKIKCPRCGGVGVVKEKKGRRA